MKYVNQPVRKKDAMQLVTGQTVYVDDIAPKDCLIVKLLRSPYANAMVTSVNKAAAMKVDGIEAIYTWEDIPQDGRRYTQAGQTYPEPSPYDRLLIDRHVRFVGDVVAIVAGRDEKCVDKALKLIKVQYEVLEPLLDFRKAKDNPILVHPEENWESLVPVGADNRRNLCAHDETGSGDIEEVLKNSEIVIDRVYHTKACQQTMMETFRTFCTIDTYGRLNVVSSTQIVFHCRRIISNALHIPKTMIRVSKPRIGGGFGAKQTSVSEVYPAYVTWMTKKPSKIIFSREESMIASTPRHEMEIHVRVGADKNGIVNGIDMYTLSNTGAYGEHSSTTVGLSGHKSIALYRHTEAYRFSFDVVYTNVQAAGAYRGYGATQGIFAVESAVNELAHKMGMDPVKLKELNMPVEGGPLPGYHDVPFAQSCSMDRCMARAKKMMDWDSKYPRRDMGNGKVRGVGVAMAMQGSSIAGVDVGGADIKLNEDGSYTLALGCTDMGTGCDTIMAQIAADCLNTPMDNIVVFSVDTDISPYDSGSYASSTTYTTGVAVMKACEELKKRICKLGAEMLEVDEKKVDFDGSYVFYDETLGMDATDLSNGENNTENASAENGFDSGDVKFNSSADAEKKVSLEDIALKSTFFNNIELQVVKQHSSPLSPPPFMVGMVEVEVDTETGNVDVLDYVAAVDCGTPINPNLARVQTEGGIAQGIGMALSEEVQYTDRGKIRNNSFMQYKIPTRQDIGNIRVEFESSYEKTGPFGAKSIGELVIDTPCPALAEAIYNATGVRLTELPMTPEKIAMGILKKQAEEQVDS